MKGKGFCLGEFQYHSIPLFSSFSKLQGRLRFVTQSFPDIGFVKHSVSISTKRMDTRVNILGISKPEMGMRADFSFSYQLGILSLDIQKLNRWMQLLHSRYGYKCREHMQYGNETETVGGSGVPQRIADYLEAYWREVLKNEVSLLRERFTRE